MSALPGISDINLFRYCQGIIDLDAEIPDRAFDLRMSEQKLDGPEIASPPVDQGSLRLSEWVPKASGPAQRFRSTPIRAAHIGASSCCGWDHDGR
jgi:hypothetical protein